MSQVVRDANVYFLPATPAVPEKAVASPWHRLRTRVKQDVWRLRFAIAGDLLASLPRSQWPSEAELLPSIVGRARQRGGPPILHPLHQSSASERIAGKRRAPSALEA